MEARGFWIIGIVRMLVGIIANLVQNASQSARLAKLND